MFSPHPKSSRYHNIMMFYLIAGAVGTLFVIGATLGQLGWLEPSIRTLFGESVDKALQNLEVIGVFLTFGLVVFLPCAAIAALIHLFWYRGDWHVVLPSALIVIAIASFSLMGGPYADAATTVSEVALATYFLTTFLIGLEWVLRRRSTMPEH